METNFNIEADGRWITYLFYIFRFSHIISRGLPSLASDAKGNGTHKLNKFIRNKSTFPVSSCGRCGRPSSIWTLTRLSLLYNYLNLLSRLNIVLPRLYLCLWCRQRLTWWGLGVRRLKLTRRSLRESCGLAHAKKSWSLSV